MDFQEEIGSRNDFKPLICHRQLACVLIAQQLYLHVAEVLISLLLQYFNKFFVGSKVKEMALPCSKFLRLVCSYLEAWMLGWTLPLQGQEETAQEPPVWAVGERKGKGRFLVESFGWALSRVVVMFIPFWIVMLCLAILSIHLRPLSRWWDDLARRSWL